MKRFIVGVAFSLIVSAANSLGAVIDFTSADFSGMHGSGNFNKKFEGVDYTVSTTGGTLFWENDGFGTAGGVDNDEIDSGEVFTVTFNGPHFVEAIRLNDFFPEKNTVNNSNYNERGFYSIDGGMPVEFSANNANGFLDVPINQNVTSISFFAASAAEEGERHEFAFAGFTATPEPNGFVVFAVALAMFWFGLRRRGAAVPSTGVTVA